MSYSINNFNNNFIFISILILIISNITINISKINNKIIYKYILIINNKLIIKLLIN